MLCELVYPGEKLVHIKTKMVLNLVNYSVTYYGRSSGYVPGAYNNYLYILVKWPDGSVSWLGAQDVEPYDMELYNNRLSEYINPQLSHKEKMLKTRIGDLPNTHIWEGDYVSCPRFNHIMVVNIDYDKLVNDENNDSGIYIVSNSFSESWNAVSGKRSETHLLCRGNIWNYYHGKEVFFKSVYDEADFFKLLGHFTELINPKTGGYTWLLDEALTAIKTGYGHSIISGDKYNTHSGISVIKYDNQSLGERITNHNNNMLKYLIE